MQLGLFAKQLETRASRIAMFKEKAGSGHIIQRDTLLALFLPTETNWIADIRQNTLVFDRESGIRVQTMFDLIEGARQKIESSIGMHGVLVSSSDDSIETLDEIEQILISTASDCRDVEMHLENHHQLNEGAA